ncbi:Arc family DNA-binding protein [Rhizobium sp. LjRoot254]|uniref:Arc family DNA-binding protein n=1 Tax=Rhizobium sp. LjRoot254 TaxID=3342297 RepID=UPI003ECE77D4
MKARREQYIVRMPDGMRERIKEIAAENRRSMNAEIVVMLEKQVQQRSPETQNGSVMA